LALTAVWKLSYATNDGLLPIAGEKCGLSIEKWAPGCKIVYDKSHIMQHANDAIDEVRPAEFFRQGKAKRELIKGKKCLLMSRWRNLSALKRGELNRLFGLNRRIFEAYLLKRKPGTTVEL
jgi:hypothetical protein